MTGPTKELLRLKEIDEIQGEQLGNNGSEETVVDPANAARIAEGSDNPASQQMILEGADHTFNIFTGDMTAFDQMPQ